MTAVEAMASGKPVIAVGEGGYLESIVDGKTGMLIKCHEDDLVRAVRKVGRNPGKFRDACVRQAKKFDVSAFFSGIDALIAEPFGTQAVEIEPVSKGVRLPSKP
jgi:glycosyltransferase involved in cell wall biosynthesis